MLNIKRCLVVVAHPDDEVLGCGGFIKKLRDMDVKVHVLFINSGYEVRFAAEGYTGEDYDLESKNQISQSALQLDFTWTGLRYESGRFEEYPQNKINEDVLKMIEEFRPDTIMTHDGSDLHDDHLVVNKAVMVASRCKEEGIIKTIITFPTQSSSEINPLFQFQPNIIVDIEDQLECKLKAMEAYRFEWNEGSRSASTIKKWCEGWGLQSPNKGSAEPYKIIKMYL